MKNIAIVLFALLAICITPKVGRAAFIVQQSTTDITIVKIHPPKPFMERKIPIAIAAMRHAAKPEGTYRDHSKPGWPGVLSFACSLFALASIFLASLPGLAVLVSFYLLAALAGIIFGGIGLNRHKYSNTGYATAGLILGILEIVGLVLLVALAIAALAAL